MRATIRPAAASGVDRATRDGRVAMHLVDLDRVSLRYGEDADGTLALHGTTLQVRDGAFVAVVGPSGGGKSTLMKVVTGLWPPTAGAVMDRAGGAAVTHADAVRRTVPAGYRA